MARKSSGCIQVDIGLKSNPCGACDKCYRKRKRKLSPKRTSTPGKE